MLISGKMQKNSRAQLMRYQTAMMVKDDDDDDDNDKWLDEYLSFLGRPNLTFYTCVECLAKQ